MMDHKKMSLGQTNNIIASQRNVTQISSGVLLKTIRIPKNLNMLSGRLPKKNYDSNSGVVDTHEYGLSMMSLGIDLMGTEPG